MIRNAGFDLWQRIWLEPHFKATPADTRPLPPIAPNRLARAAKQPGVRLPGSGLVFDAMNSAGK